jgi:hypothetical protein
MGGPESSGSEGTKSVSRSKKNTKIALFPVQFLSYRETRTYMGKAQKNSAILGSFSSYSSRQHAD